MSYSANSGGLIGPRSSDGLVDLPLGGGLLNCVLQSLTGPLQDLDIPTPQIIDLKAIPGDDPDHQFQAPGPTDVRGNCPTLNTLANHGYLSRDGITSFAEAANGISIAYGFDYPLSVFLSALGLMAGGDLISGKYSIGGADSRVPNTIGPAGGIDKHGVFEIDGSITRQDTYFGNNANFILQRWEEYVKIADRNGGLFGAQMQAEDRLSFQTISPIRFLLTKMSISRLYVSHAERVFVYEGLTNGTTPNKPDYANIAPFFLNETFPENWYRRGEAFTLASTLAEALDLFLLQSRELGANEGLNNFVPLELDLGSKTVPQLGCFLVENIFDVVPDQVQPTIADNYELFEGFVKGILAPLVTNDGFFNCPTINFVKPGENADHSENGSQSAHGSLINGAYPGIGIIKPDSEPSYINLDFGKSESKQRVNEISIDR
ncbi:hypothetical protein N7481_010842 [Penicillium waksmanii]|uniref:uncharacterized protein n=1 Tax=Penicillium waksmanii TaxID=69791 RepID=UPI00254853C8|nr:uncharacterized protein N7481_010842 [Penicillium waksmanii]KAJ5973632.1 hypothetical protein N7481_010842 [Penicillium waksmanii]